MHPLAQKVQEILRQLDATGQVLELDESTATAAEAAATLGIDVAQIAKSLVFIAGEQPVLVIASGRHRVSAAKLSELVGGKVARPDAATVKRLTGFPIGGVPPVGHLTQGLVLIDETLQSYDELWAAAGTPRAVFRTDAAELLRLTGGRLADVKA